MNYITQRIYIHAYSPMVIGVTIHVGRQIQRNAGTVFIRDLVFRSSNRQRASSGTLVVSRPACSGTVSGGNSDESLVVYVLCIDTVILHAVSPVAKVLYVRISFVLSHMRFCSIFLLFAVSMDPRTKWCSWRKRRSCL